MVEVANYVTEDPRFTELLNELVPEAIDLELGQVDDYSVVQIITSIQQHLRCSPNHSQIHYPRCPHNYPLLWLSHFSQFLILFIILVYLTYYNPHR